MNAAVPTDAAPDQYAALVDAAEAATRDAYDPDRLDGAHLVGAAAQTADGAVYTGVSLPANVGRASVCAEPIAIGAAIVDGGSDFEAIVAVGHPRPERGDHAYEVIPPCGVCRELIVDYGRDITVLVPEDGEVDAVPAMELLPTRTW